MTAKEDDRVSVNISASELQDIRKKYLQLGREIEKRDSYDNLEHVLIKPGDYAVVPCSAIYGETAKEVYPCSAEVFEKRYEAMYPHYNEKFIREETA